MHAVIEIWKLFGTEKEYKPFKTVEIDKPFWMVPLYLWYYDRKLNGIRKNPNFVIFYADTKTDRHVVGTNARSWRG